MDNYYQEAIEFSKSMIAINYYIRETLSAHSIDDNFIALVNANKPIPLSTEYRDFSSDHFGRSSHKQVENDDPLAFVNFYLKEDFRDPSFVRTLERACCVLFSTYHARRDCGAKLIKVVERLSSVPYFPRTKGCWALFELIFHSYDSMGSNEKEWVTNYFTKNCCYMPYDAIRHIEVCINSFDIFQSSSKLYKLMNIFLLMRDDSDEDARVRALDNIIKGWLPA